MAGFNLTSDLVKVLTEYNEDVAHDIDDAAETCAKGLQKDLRKGSPKRKGDYSKSWANRHDAKYGVGSKVFTVYNRKHYQLTHLLEHGHGGPKPAPPHVHIAPAEKKWTEQFEKLCEEACKG